MFHADLHIHSRFSRACSKDCDIPHLAWWALRKGITVVGTGDFTHPAWAEELKESLVPAEPGLLRLRPDLEQQMKRETPASCLRPVRFMLSVEISTIYRRGDRTRKVHHLLYAPEFEAADRITKALSKIGNLASDGRPILGLDSRDLLEITLNGGAGCYLVPAHVWTPWFAALGSRSGFDSVAECYADLAGHVFAIETGLSSDPPMNWTCSALDSYRLVSNSDAHSPPMLGREATSFSTDLDYFAMADALRTGNGLAGTLEFYPEEGKYHLDGHRKCGVRLEPEQTRDHGGLCPKCDKPLTVGVLHRVAGLADRPAGYRPAGAAASTNLLRLPEIIAEIMSVGSHSKRVSAEVGRLVAALGPELEILTDVPYDEITRVGGALLGEAVARLRRGEVIREAGFDGEYGTIRLMRPGELQATGTLFDLPAPGPGNGDATERLAPGRSATTPAASAGKGRAPDSADGPAADGADSQAPAKTGGRAPRGPGSQATHGAGSQPRHDANGQATPETGGRAARGPGSRAAHGPGSRAAHGADSRRSGDADGQATRETGGRAGRGRAARAASALLDGLDPQQRAAATAPGPVLIVAGPGTGKTRTLTHRIAYRISEGRVRAGQCLALTFTRRAAEEMRQRLAALAGLQSREITVTTFHGLGLQILRQNHAAAGLAPDFAVADEAATLAVAAELAGSAAGGRRMFARMAGDADARASVAAALAARGLVDFDRLVELSSALLGRDPELASALRQRWPSVSVDEYQDIDERQYELLRLLTADPAAGGDLTVIGDPDQAIYGFRGCDVGFFLRFAADFPAATEVELTTNYRSAPHIVTGALQAVAPSTLVPGRRLRAAACPPDAGRSRASARGRTMAAGGPVTAAGGPVTAASGPVTAGGRRAKAGDRRAAITVHEAPDERAEAEWIAAEIDRLLGGASFHSLDSGRADGQGHGGLGLADIAVLYRTDSQAGPLTQALTRAGLPCQKRSHDRLAGRAGVAEIVREMRLTEAGPATAADTGTDQRTVGHRMRAAVRRVAAGSPPAAVADIRAAGEVLRPLADRCDRDMQRFLTEIAVGAEADALDPRADAVPLLTLHAAKGLEFEVVFLAGCERGLLPLWFPGADLGTAADEAEERRLLFVGMTRARSRLLLSCAAVRTRYGASRPTGPSAFLAAIDPGLLARDAPAARPRAARQLRLL
jgi:DNA helicase-2/ATP-dependent DNA helicase PcrA